MQNNCLNCEYFNCSNIDCKTCPQFIKQNNKYECFCVMHRKTTQNGYCCKHYIKTNKPIIDYEGDFL